MGPSPQKNYPVWLGVVGGVVGLGTDAAHKLLKSVCMFWGVGSAFVLSNYTPFNAPWDYQVSVHACARAQHANSQHMHESQTPNTSKACLDGLVVVGVAVDLCCVGQVSSRHSHVVRHRTCSLVRFLFALACMAEFDASGTS